MTKGSYRSIFSSSPSSLAYFLTPQLIQAWSSTGYLTDPELPTGGGGRHLLAECVLADNLLWSGRINPDEVHSFQDHCRRRILHPIARQWPERTERALIQQRHKGADTAYYKTGDFRRPDHTWRDSTKVESRLGRTPLRFWLDLI